MTVALLVRDSPTARLLAHRVADAHELLAVVVESGRDARRAKLARELRRGLPWRLPLTILDVLAVATYQRLWSRFHAQRAQEEVSPRGWPDTTITQVNDVNNPTSVALLTRLRPDVCLVLGTGILRGPALSLGCRYTLNIHGGIVPMYRNVHSDFWAVLRNDFGNIGVTIIHLDEGIDSGAIALQRRLLADPAESLFSIRYRNARLSVETAMDALAVAADGQLPAQHQDTTKRGFFRTPGFIELVRMATRQWHRFSH